MLLLLLSSLLFVAATMPQQKSLAHIVDCENDENHHQQLYHHNHHIHNNQSESNPSNDSNVIKQSISNRNNDRANGNSASTANNIGSSSSNNKSTKPNGLKNRIIQRPPPLILDKVSNFYDNQQTNDPSHIAQHSSNSYNPAKIASTNNTQLKNTLVPTTAATETTIATVATTTTTTTNSNDNTTTTTTSQVNQTYNNINNSANQKFWASLNNQNNASRTNRATIIVANKSTNNSTISTVESKESPLDGSHDILGADLIISHRNNITNDSTNTSNAKLTTNGNSRISKSSNNINSNLALVEKSQFHQQLTSSTAPVVSTSTGNLNELIALDHIDEPSIENNGLVNNATNNNNSATSMSNASEFDNSSTHGGVASENGGGNLIGVDNPTPPATVDPQHNHNRSLDEPPTSASSSRPRSNNPFLEMDDDPSPINADSQYNSAQKRPASFIAATDSNSMTSQYRVFDQNTYSTNHLLTQEKLENLNLTESTPPGNLQSNFTQINQPCQNIYFTDKESFLVDHHKLLPPPPPVPPPPPPPHDQRDSSIYRRTPLIMAQHHQQQTQHQLTSQPSIYGVYGGGNYINFEPTISIDSESTVCKPPPSATMQLPHWTDAIYELNNAILETSSVAGGAENGEFIYIVESGDVILELDRIKVSGFTHTEFSELLESKQVHLLRAVQTKHSHGLSTDLKHYLNCSFSKYSTDKELQDLIRENIYRRTIPCTTRPPRDGEVDKVDYHFLTKEQFVEMNNRGMLLECGMYGGHYYGTLKPFSDLDSLSIYGSVTQREISEDMRQPLNANHPAIGLGFRKDPNTIGANQGDNPLYENHESLKLHQSMFPVSDSLPFIQPSQHRPLPSIQPNSIAETKPPSIVAVDTEALPHGWERVIDQTHGTYYIDHNTQRTQYERPYEIELTKGAMGFGFTLVEADNGFLLVRSVIPGGPAHSNGTIRPGDILISAVGVSVAGLQHTDIARLFSTFAVGDRVRLTFARSTYVVDADLVPDEYLFSNGTNGDLTVAVNSNYHNFFNQNMLPQGPHILVNQEFEYITVTLKRGDQGFGFTISDSVAGQKVRKIQNNEACSNLKQGDILISLNGQDITKLTHKELVERLKNFPPGQDVVLCVKRKKRFRSKTPMAMHTENDEYSVDSTPQRNCKTPNLDGLMLRQAANLNDFNSYGQFIPEIPPHSGSVYQMTSLPIIPNRPSEFNATSPYSTLPNIAPMNDSHSLYGVDSVMNSDLYYNQHTRNISPPTATQLNGMNTQLVNFRPPSNTNSEGMDNLSQTNRYSNFVNSDKLMMMQHQHQMIQPPISMQTSDYHQMPLYSNSDMLDIETSSAPMQAMRPVQPRIPIDLSYNPSSNYYANNEEIAQQRLQYGFYDEGIYPTSNKMTSAQPYNDLSQKDDYDDYEYHQIDLDRENTDSNWGIRLIGGSEVERAISIGSIVFGGAASKNGKLKSGDEIITINGKNVVGATHQHVVELISACSNRASLKVRRKKYGEACEVVLTRNMDEGFGFVIISSGNCALIGRIIEGSPADRCQQLHVRDRIIAVNGRYITPNMQHPEIVNMIKESGSTLRLSIIPADCYTVELIKNAQSDNFGFSMRGGSEYDGTPLYILRVAPNGLARDLLNVGDQIIEINSIPTVGMTHQQAATIIKYSDPIVKLKLRRNYVTPPIVLVDSPRALQKFNQVTAEMKTVNQSLIHIQDGSMSSDLNSSLNAQPQDKQGQSGEANIIYGQSVPLYAS